MRKPTQNIRGFSLIEILVAFAVLALLAVLFVQALNATSGVVAQSSKDLDVHADMRQALDRLTMDLAAKVRRDEVPTNVLKQPGNDALIFKSSVPAAPENGMNPRGIALVAYRVSNLGPSGNSSDPIHLQRSSQALTWSNSARVLEFIDPTAGTPVPSAPPDAAFDALGPGVFRFEVTYIAAEGPHQSLERSDFPSTSREFDRNVAALVVTVAALDRESRRILSDPQRQIADLAESFPDSENGTSTIDAWSQLASESDRLATDAGIPLRAASAVRVMQRRIPLR